MIDDMKPASDPTIASASRIAQTCHVTLGAPVANQGHLTGSITVPSYGTVVMQLSSPRPFRMRIGGIVVAEEDLFWRRYERQVRGVIVLPLAAGTHAVDIEYGPRSTWPAMLDHDCPSRNRERVRAGLRIRIPDVIAIAATVTPKSAAPACVLRFIPTQCVIDGITWQHVLVRILPGSRALMPSLTHDRPGRMPVPKIELRSPVAPFVAREVTNDDDRTSGIHRLLVPVASPEEPLPIARAIGAIEDRLEPEAIVVRELSLRLEDATPPMRMNDFEAQLTTQSYPDVPRQVMLILPVHEGQGRLAPFRERHEITWPDDVSLKAALPRPRIPSEHAQWMKLWDHAWDMLQRLRRKADPHSGLPNDYFGTAMKNFSDHIFVWDSCFTTMAAAWGWRAYPAQANLNCLHSRQCDGGYVPRETDVHDGTPAAFEPDFSPNPPLQVVAEWKLAALTGDILRLRRVYPVLVAQHRWLIANRGLENGTLWTTGLANGLDNSPSLGDGYPCLTSQMAHAAELLGLMAAQLGLTDDAAMWATEHQRLGTALNDHLWSDTLGIYSTSLPEGGHNPNKVVTGFWPLWAGVVPPARIERLAQQLLDPTTFGRHHPLPSLAADSPHFRPAGDYWLGSVWAPTTAAAIWGFARAGRHDLARKTAMRHLDVLSEVFRDTGVLWENFCSERSERGSWSGPDYSWTSVGPIALLLEVIIGIEPNALTNTIRWHVPAEVGWGVERIPLGTATIDLVRSSAQQITVACDRPFVLELVIDGKPRRHELSAGDHRLTI